MSELKKILENFTKLEGVRGAMVVGHDGAVQESFVEREMDLDSVARLVSSCVQLGESTAQDMNLDTLNQSYVQYADVSVTSEVLGSRASLVILADSGANLGRIRLEIRKNRKIIEGFGA
jgi:predicted regulator of Ras-like GTPase activity (Roadblock/LC7/MglB family)